MLIKLFLSLFLTNSLYAQTAGDIQLLSERLSQVQTRTAQMGAVNNCAPDNKSSCDFNSLCQSYTGKSLQASLYKNSKNEEMPNYLLLSLNSSLSRCTGQTEKKISNNPLLYPADLLMGSKTLAADRKIYEDKVAQADLTLQETKKRIIKILESRKSENTTHNAKIDNMIARVQVIRLHAMKIGDMNGFLEKGCESPNAYYLPTEASVVMCPQVLAAPEASIASILAHEVTHSIDPCTLDSTLKIDGKAYGPLPLSENPVKEVVMCLASKESAHMKGLSKSDVKTSLETDIEYLKMMNESARAEQVRGQLKNLDKAHQDVMFCNSSGHRHVQEFFADWMAAQVVGQRLNEMPEGPKKKEYALDSQAHLQALECPQIALEIVDHFKNINGKEAYQVCPDLAYPYQVVTDFDSKTKTSDQYPGIGAHHPATETRLSNVIFAEPHLRKAMGCATNSKTSKNCR